MCQDLGILFGEIASLRITLLGIELLIPLFFGSVIHEPLLAVADLCHFI
jgi:hypothetical protein